MVVLFMALLLVPFIRSRVKTEGQMLMAEFGEDYRAYMRWTRRLVPLVH